uniref:Uncharacterized protein n=1 Tax=Anguilla anguilla TaxID=7936 RepID=A0A0E9URP1_ANGAN
MGAVDTPPAECSLPTDLSSG